jgi:hypothetical protein
LKNAAPDAMVPRSSWPVASGPVIWSMVPTTTSSGVIPLSWKYPRALAM